MAFYDGNKPGGIPGLLPPSAIGSYNWWESGALWGQSFGHLPFSSANSYRYYTGDDQYNQMIADGIQFQVGPANNFEPINQTRTEGNDDQAFWAFAAMTAAETKFPPPKSGQPSWLALAQAVFNRQAARWDMDHCNGGLRWQFSSFNNGYMDKNTISNGCFFQLAARLARYTKNETYSQWADKAYDWLAQSPLISHQFEVFDSISFTDQACDGPVGPIQWTYNIGTLIAGAAYTNGEQKWKNRLNGLLGNTQKVFFPENYGGKTMVEYACEPLKNCNKDQRSFKAYLARWLAVSAQLAPFSQGTIIPWIQTSAQNAAKACSNTDKGLACGRVWYENKDDGERDVGNQMTAMSVVQSNLILGAKTLADIGSGDSKSDPSAGGGGSSSVPDRIYTRKITTGDKAGAWLLTAVALLGSLAGMVALLVEGDDVRAFRGSWA
ncbi:mannan endo-1,6-alpha-mannosidase DCW1 [Microthyrium microscopicum]|uniref:Mannan endo-1,6-alpha-mannosidase n=1 Tax=Microthyrium microscopicum TaxID=703497 RepID=A0A6A6UEA8_9PEZI|nr:mannan endo-1,6-alpha-mannosidase DCW1 [Microthyrium microscopicum]